MAISAKDVMALRKRTGVGMMECKGALTEADGDMEQAVEILREKLKGKMDDRTDRDAGEGALAVAKNDHAIAMIELRAETDFTGRNESFIASAKEIANLVLQGPEGASDKPTDEITKIVDDLRITIKENISFARGVKLTGACVGSYVHFDNKTGAIVVGEGNMDDSLLSGICMHITAATPTPVAVDEASVPEDQLEAARQAAIQEATDSGKPQEIAEKIAAGKLRKWVSDHTLLGQIYLREMDAKKPVKDFLPQGASITQFVRFAVGG